MICIIHTCPAARFELVLSNVIALQLQQKVYSVKAHPCCLYIVIKLEKHGILKTMDSLPLLF